MKHLLKKLFFGLFLVSGISAFGQTTITFTDNGGASPFTIGGVAFTFAGATPPVWNTTNSGYDLTGGSLNSIEFSLSDVGTIIATGVTATSGNLKVSYSTDGTTWSAVANGLNLTSVNKTGTVMFKYTSAKSGAFFSITSLTYTTINPATKFDLFLEQGNLYETNRTLNFTIRAIGDNLVNGTYSTGAEVAATYKITTGATEVVAPTPALMAKSVYSFNTIITTAGDYVLTVTDDAASLAPFTYNFTVVEKTSSTVVEWDFGGIVASGTIDPIKVSAPTASNANNTVASTFYGSDGGFLKFGGGFLRVDTVTKSVVNASNYLFTPYGLQTGSFNTTGVFGLKVFVCLDCSGNAAPNKLTLSYSTDSLSFTPVAGTINVGAQSDRVGTSLSLPAGAENQPKLFLKLSKAADAVFVDPAAAIAGATAHLRYYSIFVSSSSTVSVHGIKESANLVKVYPNPAVDMVNIVVNEKSDIYLMDITGRTITSKKDAYGEVKIPLNNFIKGYYFIKVNAGVKSQAIKLLVQ